MAVNSDIESERPSQPFEGFGFLSRSQELLAEYRGHLNGNISQEILRLASLAIKLLTQYPYFLARAHRVVGEVLAETGNLEGAVYNFATALHYDPKVGVKKKLAELDSTNPASATRGKRPPYQIACSEFGAITSLSRRKSVPPGQAPRGVYYETGYFHNFCAYSKNHYSNFEGDSPAAMLTGKATISFTTCTGEWIGERNVNYLVYRFACGANPTVIATISFDLKLRLYKPGQDKPIAREITDNVTRYHINGLYLNSDGSRVYYLAGDTLHILDHNLDTIVKRKFNFPDGRGSLVTAENYHQNDSPARARALAELKLAGNPTNEEIQKAYKARLLEVHPDLNPGRPCAHEETLDVIQAFESLTKYEYLVTNTDFHKQVIVNFGNYFPAFEKLITAFCISKDQLEMHLGFWSGEVLLVVDGQQPKMIYRAERAVRALEKINGSLLIRSDRISILRSDGLVNHLSEPMNNDISWKIFPADGLLGLHKGSLLSFYMLDGNKVGEIEMRDSIADYYYLEGKIIIYTPKFIYEFAIQTHPRKQTRQLANSKINQ